MKEFLILTCLFFTYSFIGWLVELATVYLETHKFVNRGFLIGPIIPIYGVGGLLIYILLSKYQDNVITLFILSVVTCGILEYFTSYIMEKIFKNRWWDYSDKKYNINGRVCLEFACLFGIGALIMIYYLNPLFINFYHSINPTLLNILASIAIILFIIDCSLSFNIILTLKNISSNINSDSTEIITKKVRARLSKMVLPYRRLLSAFPEMKVFNKMALLKEKLKLNKKNIKEERQKKRY